MADTESTVLMYRACRTRLLTFEPLDGSPMLSERLSGGISIVDVPDVAQAPYGAIRFDPRVTSGRHQMEREALTLEVLWFHRPRSKRMELESIADVADQAMLRWRNDDGAIACVARTRSTMPILRNPADEELVSIRQTFSLLVWSDFLTQYAAA